MVSEMLSLGTYQMLKVAGILGNSVLLSCSCEQQTDLYAARFFLGQFEAKNVSTAMLLV